MFLSIYTRLQGFWFGMQERLGGERGAVATEYALLLLLIALAIVTAATNLGLAIANKFKAACNSLTGGTC